MNPDSPGTVETDPERLRRFEQEAGAAGALIISHAEDFHAHQPERNHHRVAAIHSDRVDRLQPSNTLPPLVAEGHVASDFLDRAARLHTTKH